MSNKRSFIQRAVIAFLPWLEGDFDKALRYAERAWERLCEKGYGTAKAHGPRPMTDHYKALSPKQQAGFDRFWRTYNHKQGKQRAALRWGQLGDLDDATLEHILRAAKKAADQPLPPGQVRKMAEGWLSERRWEDIAPAKTATSETDRKQQQLQQLGAELAHARKLADMGDQYWADRADELEQQINQLREATP